jgi:hypothetical protein
LAGSFRPGAEEPQRAIEGGEVNEFHGAVGGGVGEDGRPYFQSGAGLDGLGHAADAAEGQPEILVGRA